LCSNTIFTYNVYCKDEFLKLKMAYSTVPYNGDSPMKPWPSLMEKAFCLKDGSRSGEAIFYFDNPPSGDSVGISGNPPVIVLIHGLGDEADSWRYLIPLLNAGGFRVLALDLPGFGRSVAFGKASLKEHAAAVLKLLEAVLSPLETNARTVFLAGNSLGALVAETAALKRPELFSGLILIDGTIPGGPSNPGIFALAKLLFSRKWYRAYRDDPEGAWASLYPYYADLDSMPLEDRVFLKKRVMDRVESLAQEQAFFQTQRSLVWAFISAAARFARGIQSYKGKILLIWGESDRIIPLSSAETFRALRNDIRFEVIPGAGHLPQQEKPGETAQLMVDFINRV
jgi:pimeloyl-ACP methyl ester carboxylesterase